MYKNLSIDRLPSRLLSMKTITKTNSKTIILTETWLNILQVIKSTLKQQCNYSRPSDKVSRDMVDCTPRFPQATPLWKATSKFIIKEILLPAGQLDLCVNQGTPFIVIVMVVLHQLLHMIHWRSSVYWPQTDVYGSGSIRPPQWIICTVMYEDAWGSAGSLGSCTCPILTHRSSSTHYAGYSK